MQQKWVRTYPLHWFDVTLSRIAAPFSRAESLEIYARNGYFLMGIGLIIVTAALSIFGLFGLVAGSFRQLPPGVRETITYLLDLIKVKNPPESLPIIVLLFVLYWIGYYFESVRLFIGERFASLFFGILSFAIAVGEWCLERRWYSLFIVIALVVFMTWSTVSLVSQMRRNDTLERDFIHWLDQTDTFCARSTVSRDETDSYRLVAPFWRDGYEGFVSLPKGLTHPALPLHKILEELYSNVPTDKPWNEFLQSILPKLKSYAAEYQPRAKREMTDTEKRCASLINILMGRIYVRLGTECKDCQELVESNKYFDAVDDERYASAVHNGRGTIFATAFSALLDGHASGLESICQSPVQCAALGIEEYSKVTDQACSFQDKRRRNNLVDFLSRIGMHYGKLSALGIKTHIAKLCKRDVRDAASLAQCIEDQVEEMMPCTAVDPFVPVLFITAAQAYGTSAELKIDAGQDAKSEIVAAGNYLRLAYGINHNRRDIEGWGLCYFRFALKKDDKQLDPLFVEAITSGLNGLPKPDLEALADIIRNDLQTCH